MFSYCRKIVLQGGLIMAPNYTCNVKQQHCQAK